jgi:hypothetical protein
MADGRQPRGSLIDQGTALEMICDDATTHVIVSAMSMGLINQQGFAGRLADVSDVVKHRA